MCSGMLLGTCLRSKSPEMSLMGSKPSNELYELKTSAFGQDPTLGEVLQMSAARTMNNTPPLHGKSGIS